MLSSGNADTAAKLWTPTGRVALSLLCPLAAGPELGTMDEILGSCGKALGMELTWPPPVGPPFVRMYAPHKSQVTVPDSR